MGYESATEHAIWGGGAGQGNRAPSDEVIARLFRMYDSRRNHTATPDARSRSPAMTTTTRVPRLIPPFPLLREVDMGWRVAVRVRVAYAVPVPRWRRVVDVDLPARRVMVAALVPFREALARTKVLVIVGREVTREDMFVRDGVCRKCLKEGEAIKRRRAFRSIQQARWRMYDNDMGKSASLPGRVSLETRPARARRGTCPVRWWWSRANEERARARLALRAAVSDLCYDRRKASFRSGLLCRPPSMKETRGRLYPSHISSRRREKHRPADRRNQAPDDRPSDERLADPNLPAA